MTERTMRMLWSSSPPATKIMALSGEMQRPIGKLKLALAAAPWGLGDAPTPWWLLAPALAGVLYIVTAVKLSVPNAHAAYYFRTRSCSELSRTLWSWSRGKAPRSPTSRAVVDGIELVADDDAAAMMGAEELEENQVQAAIAASLATGACACSK